jgi:hypothetical protein
MVTIPLRVVKDALSHACLVLRGIEVDYYFFIFETTSSEFGIELSLPKHSSYFCI